MKIVIPIAELEKAIASNEFRSGLFEIVASGSESKVSSTATLSKYVIYFGNYVGADLKAKANFEDALSSIKGGSNARVC